jgi:hypothetical protein
MTTLLSLRPWRQISPLSLYWRRRRRMTAFTPAPLRIVELRTCPVTRLSVHQHFHHASHSRLVLSPTHSSVTTTPATASRTGVTERIVVKRLLEARPLDAPNGSPSPRAVPAVATAVAHSARGSSRPVTTHGQHDGRRPSMRRSRLHRIRTLESERLTTDRTRHDTTRVARTMQLRETRWRQGIDVVRLEWRKATQSPPRQEDAVAAAARGAAPAASARTSPESVASTPARPTHLPRRDSAPPLLTMDRSTLDRLADTVMQRIERRVRIERERRGL